MLFSVDRRSRTSLQEQLRRKIVAAILDGQLLPGAMLPSTRLLASQLHLSRTTVVIVYEKLVEDGFLISRDRSGFRVNPDAKPASQTAREMDETGGSQPGALPAWTDRFKRHPGRQRNISKPRDWQQYQYPFVYGQPDPALFPLAAWRECSRQAMSDMAMRDWSRDAIAHDDPHLVQEIKTKLLPRRGVFAKDSEILITLGAQNALFLIASQLIGNGTRVGVEDPGYPDARNIFDIHGADLTPLSIDENGAVIDDQTGSCQYLFLTPSHQSPSTVTMSAKRRRDFLQLASDNDQIIIEDDFESETNYLGASVSAMKADDAEGRVIYVGSLSKSMFPGLRLGYIVANSILIEELRALRRLMLRHAPSNNQRTTSLFITQGFHDTYIRKLNRIYRERWQVMQDSIEAHLPGMGRSPTFGGTSFWLQGGQDFDAEKLAKRALGHNIVIEPGHAHFMEPENNKNYFRLGFSSIPADRIEGGLLLLSQLLEQ